MLDSEKMGVGHYRLSLLVSPDTLGENRVSLTAMVRHFTSDGETTNHLLLAFEEALQNIVRYGYRPEQWPGSVEVDAWLEGRDLVVKFRDFAAPADLDRIKPREWDPSHPGGLGMRLILASMDDVRYTHAANGDGNVLLMRKHLG